MLYITKIHLFPGDKEEEENPTPHLAICYARTPGDSGCADWRQRKGRYPREKWKKAKRQHWKLEAVAAASTKHKAKHKPREAKSEGTRAGVELEKGRLHRFMASDHHCAEL
jgi:hypothetical protein